MNDDELDALLREAPRPESEREVLDDGTRRAPAWEWVLFALVAIAVLGWAAGVLSGVFGA